MTIPSTNSQLLVTEDWKKLYQSFTNADFQSYDFDTIRRTMINYLQEKYPEDFNDYIESSEYIALIDLIAYIAQNLSFRIDLNARENFLETAQRRESILRLAQLISYSPKRNTPANGLLKLTAISTTDNVIDSNGTNLANTTIVWNDSTNNNWYQQFINVFNSAISGGFSFGKPEDRDTINGILTEQYSLNSTNSGVPLYGFNKNINGVLMNFELVSAKFSGKPFIYEAPPRPTDKFSLLYQNDNQGSGSSNTGFFVHFRQGNLGNSQFSITAPVPNEIIGINVANINDTDVWLWQLDADGNPQTLWNKIPSVVGNNVIYNSLDTSLRNIYSVITRNFDQIDLNFADGSFGNLPSGQFIFYYRQSNGLTYTIKPEQMSGILVDIPYSNVNGQAQTLTLTLSLQYDVLNSAPAETNSNIQLKAPQAYYVQNRMITGEDYNIAPLAYTNDILKVKSINRLSSGISKYFDMSDTSGKYSKTDIFATDGILYKDPGEGNFEFTFTSRNEIYTVIKQRLEPILTLSSLRNFYLDEYPRPSLTDLGLSWVQVNKTSGQSRGYFINSNNVAQAVGSFSSTNLSYATTGALIKFVPPTGKYFLPNGSIVSNQSSKTVRYLWVKVVQVIGDGYNSGKGALDDGTGPVILSNYVDSQAIPIEIIPKFVTVWSYAFETELVNLCLKQRNFGLSFNSFTRTWDIITDTNLNLLDPFSLIYESNFDNTNQDSSWLISFTWQGSKYRVRYRGLNYIFESEKQTAFFIDTNSVNYDFINGTVVKDQIDVLSFNTAVTPAAAINTSTLGSLGNNYIWQVDGPIVESDGYIQPKKVKVSFYDYNNLGQINDPDAFNNIVEPLTTSTLTTYQDKFVYFKYLEDGSRYELVDSSLITAVPLPENVSVTPSEGDLYYFYDPSYNVVKSYTTSSAYINDPWIYQPDYFVKSGRSDLNFHYIHNSSDNRRLDPGKSNIIDVYVLTTAYDNAFRTWLASGATGAKPLEPTSQSLENAYSSVLEPIKAISDEMIFQSVKYKVLFGPSADYNLQATFKAVQNPASTASANNIIARIVTAINNFFALDNWDFGESFYFSELSTYIMNQLTPDITNFVIVPRSGNFGSLYEIACQSNEILISGAGAAEIEVIDAITASKLNLVSFNSGTGTP